MTATSADSPQELRVGSMRELLCTAVPLMVSSGTQALMNAADRAVLAGWSADALAAVSPASMLYWTCICIPLGVVLYANTFIAQYDGAGRHEGMMAALWQAAWIALLAGVLLPILIPVSRFVLIGFGQQPEIAELQSIYFNTLCGGSSLVLLSSALSCYFAGRRRTRLVMTVGFVSVGMNFFLDWLLVFGWGVIPALGIRGAALATLCARFCEILIYGLLIAKESRSHGFPLLEHCRPTADYLLKYLRFGLPSGMHFFVDYSGFAAFLLMIGSVGGNALGATNLAFSVNGLIFVPLLGFGTAVQTIVGHHLGAGDHLAARRTTRHAVVTGTVWTGVTGALLVLLPTVVLRPFFLLADETAEMMALNAEAGILLRFVAVYSVFDALAVVFASALRGAGDTLFPMLLTLFSSWCIMVLPAWLMLQWTTPSLQQMWLAPTAGIIVAGILMWLRFRSGKWLQFRITNEVHS